VGIAVPVGPAEEVGVDQVAAGLEDRGPVFGPHPKLSRGEDQHELKKGAAFCYGQKVYLFSGAVPGAIFKLSNKLPDTWVPEYSTGKASLCGNNSCCKQLL